MQKSGILDLIVLLGLIGLLVATAESKPQAQPGLLYMALRTCNESAGILVIEPGDSTINAVHFIFDPDAPIWGKLAKPKGEIPVIHIPARCAL